jgi:hypothetical protein
MAPFMPAPYLRDLNERKAGFYSAFAAAAAQGENRLIEGAGHSTLHTDRPDVVIEAIGDLIDRAAAACGIDQPRRLRQTADAA